MYSFNTFSFSKGRGVPGNKKKPFLFLFLKGDSPLFSKKKNHKLIFSLKGTPAVLFKRNNILFILLYRISSESVITV